MRAKRRTNYLKDLLDKIGIGGERVEMFNMSSAEGPKFAQAATEMTERLKVLGPNPAKAGAARKAADAAEKAGVTE